DERPWLASLAEPDAAAVFHRLCTLRARAGARRAPLDAAPLLAEILQSVDAARSLPLQPTLHPVVRAALDYMVTHPQARDRLTDLARRLFVSEGHLCYLFRTYLGCSPLRLWRLIQIHETCYRLLSGHESLAALARDVGFESRRGLQRAFRRVIGMTAETYRNEAQRFAAG
ncbi:MAG TPA: AraC family transcriptional regulator, partial [Limnochordia bacterium]